MNLRLKRTPGIYVVGFMGCRQIHHRPPSGRTGWDGASSIIDDEIEAAEKTTIAQIFDTRGEAEFRRIEAANHRAARALRSSAGARRCWRWAAARSPSRRIASWSWNNGIAIWLDCPFEIVQRRVAQASHRPLARDPEKFAALYESRREVYALADVRIPIESDDPAVTVEAILHHPLLK